MKTLCAAVWLMVAAQTGMASAGAEDCAPALAVTRLSDGAVLVRAQGDFFALSYRHSVTLSTVRAEYRTAADGRIHQLSERFTDLGPGMSHTGTPPERDGDAWILRMDTVIERLVLRPQPAAENRLHLPDREVDLTRWPGQPLEILPLPCP
ncbi:MAG: DUF1850 domain-containing protein [Pararhodobacter sp.]